MNILFQNVNFGLFEITITDGFATYAELTLTNTVQLTSNTSVKLIKLYSGDNEERFFKTTELQAFTII